MKLNLIPYVPGIMEHNRVPFIAHYTMCLIEVAKKPVLCCDQASIFSTVDEFWR